MHGCYSPAGTHVKFELRDDLVELRTDP